MEFINIIKDHYRWKHQLWKLSLSNLRKTYSGTALGWIWALVKPSVMIFVYWFAFSVGLRVDLGTSEYSFFLWLLAGIIPWFFMSDILRDGTSAMRKYSYLITKMKFPTSVIPTFVCFSSLIVHLVLLTIMIIIFVFNGHIPDIYYAQLPLYMLLMLFMAMAFSLLASTMAAISKDFQNLVKSFITAVFWLSGIMWDSTSDEFPTWIKTIMDYNPVNFIVEGYRNVFVHKQWFFEDTKVLIIFLVELIVIAILAVGAYKKLKKEIPDVL